MEVQYQTYLDNRDRILSYVIALEGLLAAFPMMTAPGFVDIDEFHSMVGHHTFNLHYGVQGLTTPTQRRIVKGRWTIEVATRAEDLTVRDRAHIFTEILIEHLYNANQALPSADQIFANRDFIFACAAITMSPISLFRKAVGQTGLMKEGENNFFDARGVARILDAPESAVVAANTLYSWLIADGLLSKKGELL